MPILSRRFHYNQVDLLQCIFALWYARHGFCAGEDTMTGQTLSSGLWVHKLADSEKVREQDRNGE